MSAEIPQLTNEQREQIRAEEIFRRELQRSLDAQTPPPSGRARAWALLNSSFVLWLLSSVVVSLLAAQYAAFQTNQAERVRTQNLVRRLDTEIGNRIHYAGIDLELIRQNTDYQSRARPDGKETLDWTQGSLHQRIASFLDNSVPNHDPLVAGHQVEVSVYPEYRSSRFHALIIELIRLVPSSETAALQSALSAYLKSVKLGADLSLRRPATLEEQVKAIDAASSLLLSEIQLPRWRVGTSAASSN